MDKARQLRITLNKRLLSIMTMILSLAIFQSATAQKEKKGSPIFSITGTVSDCDNSHKYIHGAILKLWGSDGSVTETTSDTSGGYHFDNTKLKKEVQYVIEAICTNSNYIGTIEKYRIDSVGYTNTRSYDFCFTPNKTCSLGFFRVYFHKNSSSIYDLDSLSMDVNDFVDVLKDNPRMMIEIHSRSNFNEEAPYQLSKKRAVLFKDILIQKGINKNRIILIPPKNNADLGVSQEDMDKLTTPKEKDAAERSNRMLYFQIKAVSR